MTFSTNAPILYVIAGAIIAIVMAQAVFFLIKAWKRGVELGMKDKLKKIVRTAIIFTIAPAIAIVISVFALAKSLGVPLPWLRLSVIGSMSYETVAATNTLNAFGKTLGDTITDAQEYATILTVMTVCIMVGIWLCPIVAEKMQKGIINIENRDKKWSDILSNSLFIGMISAFVGYVFCDVYYLWNAGAREAAGVSATSGLIPLGVFAASALVMGVCGLCMKKFKWKWMNDYALPISLIVGMAVAIPLTAWLG